MNVGPKLVMGGALTVLPLVGGLAYTAMQVDDLARAGASVAQRRHHAAQLTLHVLRGLELADEYERKLAVTGDRGYREKYDQIADRIDGWIDDLSLLELSSPEREATLALERSWRRERARATPAAEHDDTRQAANARLDAHRNALAAQARWAEERAEETRRVALLVGAGAIVASLVGIWLLARSIQRPLRRLIVGTRAVAEGNFEHRLEPLARDELGEVTEAYNQMVNALGELDRLKAELVSRVSHELRTPLVAVIETNRLLLDEIPGPINARQRRMLELHAGAAARLTAMIGDLLDLSTIEAGGALDRQPADLVDLTREVIEQLAPLAEDRSIELDVGLHAVGAIVRCDGRRYQQVVQNLVDNAFSHSPPGGVVYVGLTLAHGDAVPAVVADDSDKPRVVLRVEDEGPGVPETERERVFEKFVQGAGRRRGVGLGLAICRQIVLAHGGRIGVTDSVLGGACFVATFPLAATSAREAS